MNSFVVIASLEYHLQSDNELWFQGMLWLLNKSKLLRMVRANRMILLN
jgi:hypothetical protein